MQLKSALAFTALALLASRAWAGPPPHRETIDSLATNSDIIVVAQVLKVETAGKALEALRQIPIVRRHATLKVLRAINSSDAKPLALGELILDYPDFDPDGAGKAIVSGPIFEHFTTGQIAAFPLRRGTTTQPNIPAPWLLVSEASEGNTLPAIKEPLNATPATSVRDFLYRELDGILVHGSYPEMTASTGYLQRAGDSRVSIQPVIDLLAAQTLDDVRWVDIAMAAYSPDGSLLTKQLTLADMVAGKTPERRNYDLFHLAVEKARPDHLEERMIRAALIHQEPPDQYIGPIGNEFLDKPLFLELERAALAKSQPGAFAIMASVVIKDSSNPDFKTTMNFARQILAAPIHDQAFAFTPALSFVTRLGSDGDFTFLLEQVQAARKVHPVSSQSIMYASFNDARAYTPNTRVLKILQLFLDDTSPLALDWPEHSRLAAPRSPPIGDLRVCDQAGSLINSCAENRLGYNEKDPLPTRDQALARIRDWLKTH